MSKLYTPTGLHLIPVTDLVWEDGHGRRIHLYPESRDGVRVGAGGESLPCKDIPAGLRMLAASIEAAERVRAANRMSAGEDFEFSMEDIVPLLEERMHRLGMLENWRKLDPKRVSLGGRSHGQLISVKKSPTSS